MTPRVTGSNGRNGHNGSSGLHFNSGMRTKTGRDVLAILFRQRRLLILSFLGLFSAAALLFLFGLDRYEAQTMILVQENERADPAVSGQPNAQPVENHYGVSAEDLTSELELLRSQDLLEQVVVASGLDQQPLSWWERLRGYQHLSKPQRIEKQARDLANRLDIQILKDSDILSVSLRASDPQLAARILQTLDDLYLKKHVTVRRPAGTFDFFHQQTDQYAKGLSQAEAQLVQFVHERGVAYPQLERDTTLQKLSDFEALEGQTQASIAETEHRIKALESKVATLPARQTTLVTTSDNAQLLQQLKSTLLTLELQRIDLLEKFTPDYRPVQEVEKQVAETRAAIQQAEKSQWRQETTDRDPNFELVREELTKAQADLAGYKARASALEQAMNSFKSRALWLEGQDVHQQDLLRNLQTASNNYLLYMGKQEEARIADALDSRRILNVAVAEAALAPTLPVHSDLFYIALAGLFAGLGSLGLSFATDNLNPTLRTPDEVEALLNVPVLASLPKNGRPHANGNGHHRVDRVETHVS
jgi:protein tyrosine kinase modulator